MDTGRRLGLGRRQTSAAPAGTPQHVAPEQTVTFPESAEWTVPGQLAREECHTAASQEDAGLGLQVWVAGVGVAAGAAVPCCLTAPCLPEAFPGPCARGRGPAGRQGPRQGREGRGRAARAGGCPGQGDGHDTCGAVSPQLGSALHPGTRTPVSRVPTCFFPREGSKRHCRVVTILSGVWGGGRGVAEGDDGHRGGALGLGTEGRALMRALCPLQGSAEPAGHGRHPQNQGGLRRSLPHCGLRRRTTAGTPGPRSPGPHRVPLEGPAGMRGLTGMRPQVQIRGLQGGDCPHPRHRSSAPRTRGRAQDRLGAAGGGLTPSPWELQAGPAPPGGHRTTALCCLHGLVHTLRPGPPSFVTAGTPPTKPSELPTAPTPTSARGIAPETVSAKPAASPAQTSVRRNHHDRDE